MRQTWFPPAVSRPWIALAMTAWVVATLVSPAPRALPIQEGRFEGTVTLTGDIVDGRFGPWALGELTAGPVLVDFVDRPEAGRGDNLTVWGSIEGSAETASGRRYGAVLSVRRVLAVESSKFLPHRAGRVIREQVDNRLTPFDDGRALLAGFLIGETSRIDESDVDAMRRSGLAHFVAVSGSNVALFLGLLAVAAGPLALGPRRRAIVGLLALPVYAAATRFEPSVMRASVMAGLALGGRLLGIVLEAWQLLSLAVGVLVLTDPALTSNVGFQLSVVATAGVLVGSRWPVRGKFARALSITLGAQLAVAPLLIAHFGTVPLLSPLVNLVAAPLVAVSTVVGAVGVAGPPFMVAPAAWLAEMVLALARGAAGWPQLSGTMLLALTGTAVLVKLAPRLRAVSAGVAAAALVIVLTTPGVALPPAGVIVLDIGQGDAILLHGGDGRFALVDGGPDESLLVAKLRDIGVRELELVVLTHVHADHATGLAGVVDTFAVGEVWADTEPHTTTASRRLAEIIATRSIPMSAPEPGTSRRLGELDLVVEGPVRRYASPNDQSIVITVRGPSRSMLLSGDIETHAQADLHRLRADVLKVPHQGAGTSDAEWLASVESEVAVISVGPNDFGHPVGWVVDLLGEHGEVFRTDEDGDVVIDLTIDPGSRVAYGAPVGDTRRPIDRQ